MYHGRFKGSHYESAYHWGALLYKNKKINTNQATYQKYYPEILNEIKGIADGQKISYEEMLTFLLSMYCFEFNNRCTCLAISDESNIVFG